MSRRAFLADAALGAVALAADASAVRSAFGQTPSRAGPGAPRGADKRLNIVNLDLLEQEAKQIMSAGAYAYIGHGIGDEWTYRENRRAFSDYPLLPRAFSGLDASDVDLRTRLLGHDLGYPILVAPTAFHAFVHPNAELASVAGAGAAGALFTASSVSNKPMEQIARAALGPKWFQLYMNRDSRVTRNLLERARAAGYSAIVLTVDVPGVSDEFIRLGRPFPAGDFFPLGNYDPRYGGFGDFTKQKLGFALDDIGMIREATGLPVIVKGILRAQDALDAVQAGAAAIQVSNHGGRRLDSLPASITMLPSVAAAVGGRVPVILDSGIRRGADVFRALALGASAVALGRPILFGLAVGGASGVRSVLEHVRGELRTVMRIAGARTLQEITRNMLRS